MRSRLSVFLFFILLAITSASTLLDNYFVNLQRQNFVDKEIDEAASALEGLELEELTDPKSARGETIISQKLGHDRIGKFFILRDPTGHRIFSTNGAQLITVKDIPLSPDRLTILTADKFIRVRNLPMAKARGFVLQAGFFADRELMLIPLLSGLDVFEILVLTLIGLIIARVLAKRLMLPLRELSEQVGDRSFLSASASRLPLIPVSSPVRDKDEFSQLVEGLNVLIQRVNQGYELSRAWSFQLAHELKTPLAILNSEIESAESKKEISGTLANGFKREIRFVSDTVSSFLLWAEVEGGILQSDLHVLRLADLVRPLAARQQSHFGVKIRVECDPELKVAVLPTYLEIILNNLISNAALYSSPGCEVSVVCEPNFIEVGNVGEPFPDEVLARFGKPFNRGDNKSILSGEISRGHGLGLATVASICRVLGWEIKFDRRGEHTFVTLGIKTPSLDSAPE